MKYTIDVLTIGETVIDCIAHQLSPSLGEAASFHKYIGGSPTNIAINVARLGLKSALISRVGADPFGHFISRELKKHNVNSMGLQEDTQEKTSLVFITRGSSTPQVLHYRMADTHLQFNSLCRSLMDQARIIHFSGFTLSQEPARAQLQAMKAYALEKGYCITLDPCYHEPLWNDPGQGAKIFREFLSHFTIIKPSLDDMQRLWGSVTPEQGIDLYHEWGVEQVVLTMGQEGVLFSNGKTISHIPAKPLIATDVTGAGDAFWAGLYGGLLHKQDLEDAVKVGMKTAEITIQHLGAIAPLPELGAILT